MVDLAQIRQIAKNRLAPSLAHRDYRMMWFGHVAGESASWAIAAIEGWLIFNLAESNPNSVNNNMLDIFTIYEFICISLSNKVTNRYSL